MIRSDDYKMWQHRLIDANTLKIQTVGLCDAAGNMFGAADVVFAEDIENAPTIVIDDICKISSADGSAVEYLKTHEPLDVQRHGHGYWAFTDKEQYCSECGFVVSNDGDFTERQSVIRLWRYCPNCSVRMDKDPPQNTCKE